MLTITKRLEIDAGHRLQKHEGKCRHVHGHRYAFDITVTAQQLDTVGRIIDFSVIKAKVGSWLDQHWDHGFIAESNDPMLVECAKREMKTFALSFPPTAENLAAEVARTAQRLLAGDGIKVVSVVCWETPTSSAEYVLDS